MRVQESRGATFTDAHLGAKTGAKMGAKMGARMTCWLDPEGEEPRALFQSIDFDGAQVLEIGCGAGRLMRRCAARAAYTVGIEPNADYLTSAAKECPPNIRARVAFAQGSALALPFRNEAFDVAL